MFITNISTIYSGTPVNSEFVRVPHMQEHIILTHLLHVLRQLSLDGSNQKNIRNKTTILKLAIIFIY